MIPSKDIMEILCDNNLGIPGKSLFYSKMPPVTEGTDIEDKCVSVMDVGSVNVNPKWNRDELLIQILVRGDQNNYESAYELAYEVKNSLLGANPVTINGSLYSSFVMLSDINHLGYDDNNRPRFTLRFKITRDNYESSNRENL